MKGDLDTFIKIVVVGDSSVGKTWFLSNFLHNKLPEKVGPTLFDNHTSTFRHEGIEYELSLWDTTGAHERKKLRCIAYENADAFLICYSIDNRASYENVRYHWLPELRKRCPGVPRILIGLKSDLHEIRKVSERDAEIMAYHIQSPAYFEYSTTTPKKSQQIFAEAVRVGIKKKEHFRKENSVCAIQ